MYRYFSELPAARRNSDLQHALRRELEFEQSLRDAGFGVTKGERAAARSAVRRLCKELRLLEEEEARLRAAFLLERGGE